MRFVYLALASSVACSPIVFIASGSRYWFNYRHSSNALVYYAAARRLGVRDDSIALFLSTSSHTDDPRNVARATIVNGEGEASRGAAGIWPGGGRAAAPVETDFADSAATPSALLRALRGRAGDAAPALSGEPLLLVLTGHGGNGFLKFHDKEELSYEDLAAALAAAGNAKRYSTLLVVVDTCQAASLAHALDAARVPRAVVISSSDVGENSYAVGADDTLALAVSDSFSRDAAYTLHRASSPPSGRAWRHSDSRDNASLARLCENSRDVPPSLTQACAFVAMKQESTRWEATLGWRDAVDTVHAAPALAAGSACDHDGAKIPVSALAVSMRSRNSDSKVTAFALGFDGLSAARGSEDDKSCSLGRDLPGATAAVVERLPLLRFFAALDSVTVT
jgi:hypothetical protein